MKMGMTNIRARMENSKPPDVPIWVLRSMS